MLPRRSTLARPAYDALCKAERNLALGSESGIVVACAVMAEAILHHALTTRFAAVAHEARPDKLTREPGLGDLIFWTHRAEELAKDKLLGDAQKRALNELNRLRNGVVHAKTGQPLDVELASVRALLRTVLVPLAESVGALDPSEAARARREGRRSPKRSARVELELDRVAQKSTLLHQLGQRIDRPLHVVVLDGEKRQGHGAITEVLCAELGRHVRADWTVIGSSGEVVWPRLAHPGSRFAKLLESLAKALDESARVPQSDPLADPSAWASFERGLVGRILALQDLHDGIVVRHRVRPQSGDEDVLRAYLERVWIPAAEQAAERVEHAALALSFEIERVRPGFWLLPAWWEAFKERRLARRMGERAPRARAIATIVLPELTRVPRPELAAYLEERGLSPEDADRQARELLRLSEGGYFEDLVYELERSLAREERT
jgi:hypothetical protein